MRARRASKVVALAAALTLPLFVGCGDDEEPTNGNGDTIVGIWAATSLTVVGQPQWGDGVQDDGLVITISFNSSGGYSISVGNEDPADPWICDDTASCTYTGSYTTSGNTLVFDEGTTDEESATYSLSGNTLTITFQVASPYQFVLQRT